MIICLFCLYIFVPFMILLMVSAVISGELRYSSFDIVDGMTIPMPQNVGGSDSNNASVSLKL